MTSQGVVRSQTGDVVNGTYKLTFKLYNVQQGGTALWTETQPTVTVENGVYNVVLGTLSLLPASLFQQNAQVWLGITVEAEAELPRVRVTTVPYAFNARTAATANDVDCSGCIDETMLGFDPITKAELDAGDLAVKGVVSATKFVGDGSGLTGLNLPQGSCGAGFLVKGIGVGGALVCEKVGTTLAGQTVSGDLDVTGVLSVNGSEVCTQDANCGEELWQLACKKDQVPKWDGAMWTCSDIVVKVDPSTLPADGLNEVSNNLLYNQFSDSFASKTCPAAIKDNNPTGITDEILVDDVGIAQDLTVSINISNSDMATVEVKLYDPNNTEYILYSKNGPGQQLGTTYPKPTPTKSGDLTAWINKNPKGTWRLQVIDTGFKDNGFDGQINSWAVTVSTLSTKKVQVKGNLVVDGGLTFSGNATIAGGLMLGTDEGACNLAKKGTLRVKNSVVQWCNGTNWTFLGSNATYRWAVFSTYSQWNGCWYANNDSALFGGVNPSSWTDGNYRAVHVSSDSDILRTLFTRSGPPIGTLKNAMVYADEWYYTSSTNGKVIATLFRIRNSTANDITWKVYWYKTAYGSWNEWAGIALNGQEVWHSGGGDYNACHNTSHDITIPKNRTSTVIFTSPSGGPSGTRPAFMAFYNNSLVLPNGLEFVDDLDFKPNGWDN
jgi:subtilisin-like proprotein convertase family protein